MAIPTTNHALPGKLITLEGGEGSGKTSQLHHLRMYLLQRPHLWKDRYREICCTRQPGGSAIGASIRSLLLEGKAMRPKTELLLYAADRAEHCHEIQLQLADGCLVLCDRYTDSTIAYQGYGRQLDLDLIDSLNQVATGGLTPDLTLWLDVLPEIGLERAKSRISLNRIDRESLDFHTNVWEGYRSLHSLHPNRIVRIDAEQPEQVVTTKLIAALLQRQIFTPAAVG